EDSYDASAPRSIQLPSTSTSADPAPGTARCHTQFRLIQPLLRRRQIEKLDRRRADVAGLRRGRADGGGADDLKRRNRRRDCGGDIGDYPGGLLPGALFVAGPLRSRAARTV